MPSIVPSFAYDIFISYRHNDNRGAWVTDFVNALQEELAATIKEPLSIYFDKNPHDGLLETHDVDDSLKEKLKCLIFIPIVSQTYCDPKSFAWSNEFLVFLQQAQADAHGLKVRLSNGNTANRVLPIRIHELDARDKKTIEEVLGPLRAIDFTYQSAGVNRPLRAKDDEAVKSPSQNVYRDQVNKTANAIKEIIAGLQGKEQSAAPAQPVDRTAKASAPVYQPKHKNWKLRLPALQKSTILNIISLLSLIALSVSHFSEKEPESKTYRYTIPAPEKTTYRTDNGGHISISPDGNLLAYVAVDTAGNMRLWVRALNSLTAEALNGTEGAIYPFWSPDSHSIGFFAGGKLKKVAASDGPVQTLCNAPASRGGAWGKEGTIIFSGNTNVPISQVAETGGTPQAITKLDTIRKEISHRWPSFLPDGRHFFYLSRLGGSGVTEGDAIFLASLDTTELPTMMVKASSNVGYANGHLLFAQGTTLMAKPFDTDFKSLGDAFPVVEKVDFSSAFSRAPFSVSQNGVLVYQTGAGTLFSKLTWRDRSGKLVEAVGDEASFHYSLRLSPDGERIATAQPDGNGQRDIVLFDIKRGVGTRFTFDKGTDSAPVWSPDGKTIVFASNRNKNLNLYQRPANGEGAEQLLLQSNDTKIPTDWSRDGKFLAYNVIDSKANSGDDVWILPMDTKGANKRKPFVFLQTDFNESRATFSPDGRWIAYQSDESGRYEVYIRPFPGPGGKWQVSSGGGTRPRWRGDGKELFYMTEGDYKLMSVEVKPGPSTIEVGSAQVLFANRMVSPGPRADLYDETQDGKLFLVETQEGEGVQAPLTLVVNWVGEVGKK